MYAYMMKTSLFSVRCIKVYYVNVVEFGLRKRVTRFHAKK